MNNRLRRNGSDLWAITSYFNPVRYRRRLDNYRLFRERLGIPLLTVELDYGAGPELGPGDAEILIQLRGHDVMWQKERLLNLALARLPAECDKVAWLDCDILFCQDDWSMRLHRMLDDFKLVQAFSRVHYLTRDWRPGVPPHRAIDFTRAGVCRAIADGMPPTAVFIGQLDQRRSLPAGGFAWAARREVLDDCPLYDAAITGGGDRLLASASFSQSDSVAPLYHMQGARLHHYLAWADRWSSVVGDSVGSLDCELLNLWHGEMIDRQDITRLARLDEFAFDPSRDIAIDEQGIWRWNSDKPTLHAYLRDYFVDRMEDGESLG